MRLTSILVGIMLVAAGGRIGSASPARIPVSAAAAAIGGVDHLDTAFGDHGVARISESRSGASFSGMAIQPDGRIVAAGQYQNSLLVARYTTSGALDASFGGTGIVTATIGTGPSIGTAVVIQPDSKILVGGRGSNAMALARYSANGVPDLSFGGTGVVTTTIAPQTIATVAALALQPDGKIVAAGAWSSANGSGSALVVARYAPGGALDPSFGGGIASTNLDYGIFQRTGLALQPDGMIVVAGQSGGEIAVSRLTSGGAPDAGFGLNGTVTTSLGPNTFAYANALALQPDGKIVAAGALLVGGPPTYFALARYTSNGSLDGSFGDDGTVLTAMNGADTRASALALQPDGKIVAGGISSTLCSSVCDWRFTLARYQHDGRLDRSFGGVGSITSDVIGRLMALAIQPDGKFVVAGAIFPPPIIGQPPTALLARFVDDADAVFLPQVRR
jgi:uncharacterized delta-60 repeat protein